MRGTSAVRRLLSAVLAVAFAGCQTENGDDEPVILQQADADRGHAGNDHDIEEEA